MSIVAKSLKRLKENKKPKFSVSSSKSMGFGLSGYLPFFYGLFVLLFFAIVIIYAYTTSSYVKKRLNSTNYPSIYSLKTKLDAKKAVALSIRMQPKGLENLLILKRFDEMFKLAKKENNLKYEGIYYFKKGDLDKSYDMLKQYLKKHKNDSEASAYLAFVLYKKGDYNEALKILNAVKTDNCELIVDKAVLYEASEEYYKALRLYKKSYMSCNNPAVKNKIEKKIIVLEYFLRNRDES